MQPSTELLRDDVSVDPLLQVEASTTVLVVEDNSLVRRATCELLAQSGHHALEAANAAVARGFFKRKAAEIEAVVCDAVLPDASGVELCRFFQRERPRLPVVLTSGYPTSFVASDKDNNTYFLEKPYSGSSLVTTLESLLANKHQFGSLLPGPVTEDLQNLPR